MSSSKETIDFMKGQLIKLLTILLKQGNYGTLTVTIADGVVTGADFDKKYKLELL